MTLRTGRINDEDDKAAIQLDGDFQDNDMAPKAPSSRKSSFSESLKRISNHTFTRQRRNSTHLPYESDQVENSRLPIPSGLPRSSSFFNSINVVRSTWRTSENVKPASYAPPSKDLESLRHGSASTAANATLLQQRLPSLNPSKVVDRQASPYHVATPGLMKPIQPSPMIPRSRTMVNLEHNALLDGQHAIAHGQPSFMRSTSSSDTRRSTIIQGQVNIAGGCSSTMKQLPRASVGRFPSLKVS